MNNQKNLDSCHDQLGKIPDGWSMMKLKYLVDFNSEVLDKKTDPDFKFNYVQISDVDLIAGIKFGEKISFKNAPSSARRVLRKNDIIISTVRAYMRTISQVPECQNLIGTTGFCVLRKNGEKINFRYLYYSVVSDWFIDRVVSESEGVCYPKINPSDLVELKIFSPPPPTEQELIARYLDKKTYLIDSLVERIQKKIELLKEQRISLIDHLVTKGLDSNVEMKDSGVQWVGEIPKHWRIKKLKYISNIKLSSVDRHEHEYENRVAVCHYTDVYKNEYIDSTSVLPMGTCSDSEYERFSLRKGDILLTKDSETQDDIGIPTQVLETLDNTVCGYHLGIVQMNIADQYPEYFYRFIESRTAKNYFLISSTGVTRFGLGKESIENLFVPIPPKGEQIEIATRISSISLTTNKISEGLSKRINLLKEYRQTLISSVVTGKFRISEGVI